MMKWIPISERMPNKDGFYLTQFRNERVMRVLLYRAGEEFPWRDTILDCDYKPTCLTAWMPLPEPYRNNKPVLDEEEKAYLTAVFKPFRKKIKSVAKDREGDDEYYLCARTEDFDIMTLPSFSINAPMYRGMEPGREYTLEELGL